MDINQSPLTGYQSNKAQTSRRSVKDKPTSEASKIKEATTSSQNLKQPELHEGQLVKGQIIDLRYNEVKIQLEPGKQLVSAKLAGDVPLAIGQEAKFQVSEENSGQIVLKYMPSDTTEQTDSTVLKALTASNFPLTERNKSLVQELLNHRMPIDKTTLQNLIRVSHVNREASPQTLVLMLKNNIPMTSSNIKQYEAYQKGTNQILYQLKAITQSITQILYTEDPISSLTERSPSEFQNNTNISPQTNTPVTGYQQATQMNDKIIDILYHNTNSSNATVLQLRQILEPLELMQLSKALEQKFNGNNTSFPNLPANILQQINDGTISLKEAAKMLKVLNPELIDQKVIPDNISQTEQLQQPTDNIIHKLISQMNALQDNTPHLSDILGEAERYNLLQYMPAAPDNNNLMDRIAQGTATLKEILLYLQSDLSQAENIEGRKLLQAPEYTKLLEEAFLQKWTITPGKAADKDAVTELYQHLKEDLDQLSTLAGVGKEASEALRFREPVKNLQDNLQFMKDLNEVFTYLQLPVKFQNREAHADLYVMTRKRALNDKKEGLSVLLHLDMTNLGSLNVYVKMNQDQIQATFYLEDREACRLISENLPSLTSALHNKGYTITAEVKDNYKKPDFSKDFIEQSSQENLIHRYTFDIRT